MIAGIHCIWPVAFLIPPGFSYQTLESGEVGGKFKKSLTAEDERAITKKLLREEI